MRPFLRLVVLASLLAFAPLTATAQDKAASEAEIKELLSAVHYLTVKVDGNERLLHLSLLAIAFLFAFSIFVMSRTRASSRPSTPPPL